MPKFPFHSIPYYAQVVDTKALMRSWLPLGKQHKYVFLVIVSTKKSGVEYIFRVCLLSYKECTKLPFESRVSFYFSFSVVDFDFLLFSF